MDQQLENKFEIPSLCIDLSSAFLRFEGAQSVILDENSIKKGIFIMLNVFLIRRPFRQ